MPNVAVNIQTEKGPIASLHGFFVSLFLYFLTLFFVRVFYSISCDSHARGAMNVAVRWWWCLCAWFSIIQWLTFVCIHTKSIGNAGIEKQQNASRIYQKFMDWFLKIFQNKNFCSTALLCVFCCVSCGLDRQLHVKSTFQCLVHVHVTFLLCLCVIV